MKKSAFLITFLLALGLASFGQKDEPIVKVNLVPPAGGLKAGQTAVLTLELSIRAPYHINADQPSEDYLIGTTVDFKPHPGVTFGRQVYPPPRS